MKLFFCLLVVFNATFCFAKTEDDTSVAQPVSAYGTYNGGILPLKVDADGAVVTSGGGGGIFSSEAWVNCKSTAGSDGSLCSGSIDTTTGTITSGTSSLTVASADGWEEGMGIAIANAGTGGTTDLITYVAAISGTTFTLAAAASATASNQTVYHDDTRAIQAALDSGKNVYLQAGDYNVTSQMLIDTALLFEGDGNRGRNIASTETLTTMGTAIINRGQTNNIFSIQIGDTKMRNFAILQNTTITPTAGYAFVYGPQTKILNVGLSYITVYGTFAGIKINDGVAVGWFNNLAVWTRGSATTAALYINNDAPNGDLDFTDCDFRTKVGTPNTAIWILSADTQSFANVKVNDSDPALRIDDSGGAVINQRFVNCSFEGGTNTGALIKISATAALGVKNINFIGGEVGVTNSQDGISIEPNAGQISIIGTVFTSLNNAVTVTTTSGSVDVYGIHTNLLSGSPVSYTMGKNPVRYLGKSDGNNGVFELYTGNSSPAQARWTSRAASGSGTGFSLHMLSDDGAALASNDRLGSIAWGGSEDAIDTIGIGAQIRAMTTGAWTTSSIPTKIDFLTVPSGSTTLTPVVTFGSDGNVGIGTTKPLDNLAVVGKLSVGATANVGLGPAPANGLYVQGNVGIGTLSPGTKLDINGGFRSIADDLGWSVVDQTDNQACTTGCTSACVFGIENATGTAVTGIVNCAATTADLCLCAGGS